MKHWRSCRKCKANVAVDAPRHPLYAIDRAGSTGGTSYVRIFPLN
ncbi:MAG: hypothetical protein QOC89_999 [Paraburkholderia sp.]|nr:hypothetical protein [Paraburkholderia sp.]